MEHNAEWKNPDNAFSERRHLDVLRLGNSGIWKLVPPFDTAWLANGQIISMKENKWEKSMYEPVPGNFWNSNSHSNDESGLSSTK